MEFPTRHLNIEDGTCAHLCTVTLTLVHTSIAHQGFSFRSWVTMGKTLPWNAFSQSTKTVPSNPHMPVNGLSGSPIPILKQWRWTIHLDLTHAFRSELCICHQSWFKSHFYFGFCSFLTKIFHSYTGMDMPLKWCPWKLWIHRNTWRQPIFRNHIVLPFPLMTGKKPGKCTLHNIFY